MSTDRCMLIEVTNLRCPRLFIGPPSPTWTYLINGSSLPPSLHLSSHALASHPMTYVAFRIQISTSKQLLKNLSASYPIFCLHITCQPPVGLFPILLQTSRPFSKNITNNNTIISPGNLAPSHPKNTARPTRNMCHLNICSTYYYKIIYMSLFPPNSSSVGLILLHC